jgi:hypothetical protein
MNINTETIADILAAGVAAYPTVHRICQAVERIWPASRLAKFAAVVDQDAGQVVAAAGGVK